MAFVKSFLSDMRGRTKCGKIHNDLLIFGQNLDGATEIELCSPWAHLEQELTKSSNQRRDYFLQKIQV